MSSKLSIVIIGAGNRGQTFCRLLMNHADVTISAVAEVRDFQRKLIADAAGIPAERQFRDYRELLELPEPVADAAVITTGDALHCEVACALAERGYQLLLEKPMAPTFAECRRIADCAATHHVSLCICHVLRYTRYTQAIKQIIDSGELGEIMNLEHFEAVVYWHQAHSYVRGNWRNEKLSSFMLLAKSCHDIDLICYWLGKKCLRVSSFGSLSHFRKEQSPRGSAPRCLDCPEEVEKSCPYSACKIYLRDRAEQGDFGWPVDIITDGRDVEAVRQALREGPYGRCVYHCDNDVVDHQTVNLEFEGGVTAHFTMSAFTHRNGLRQTRICGTRGELIGDGETLTVHRFLDDSVRTIEVNPAGSVDISDGHGGGDYGLVEHWVASLRNGSAMLTGAEQTLDSHRIVFAAEESRKTHRTVELETFGK